MATQIINTATIIAANISAAGDGLIINDVGRITLTSVNTAVNVNASAAEISIAGSVTSLGAGLAASAGNSDTSVVITADGSIDAALDGISLLGFSDVRNDGTISGLNTGVLLSGLFGEVVNTGTITGRTDGIRLTGAQSIVSNSGTITASEDGIEFSGGGNSLINDGLIYGGSVSVRFSSGTSGTRNTLINTGTLSGTLFADASSEIVYNSGIMSGANLGNGDDVYDGSGGFISIVNMGVGNDEATGGSGGESFFGDSGNDTLFGNGGNDTFIYRNGDGSDLIDGGAGRDRLQITGGDALTVNLAAGTAKGAAAGTAILISIEDVFGASGNDVFTGNSASNFLDGDFGNDTLDGRGAGTDILDGGQDNDTYFIDAGDQIIDASGIDLVQSSSLSLNLNSLGGGAIENAQLLGSVNFNITGNAGANTLTGNAGKNTLKGGADDDIFVFTTRLNSAKADRITDFNRIDDVMHLQNSGSGLFNGLANGVLAASRFKANAAGTATDSDDRIVYNKTTGDLFFDRDGSGAAGAIKFATLTNKAVITAADFFVI